ncbi:MAG: Lar family restriction alleviation protein [Sphaerochaeta sp.]
MKEISKQIDLQDCPLCGGPGIMEEEGGWCFYVTCADCGCHTAEIPYKTIGGRLEAAKNASLFWNVGKVLRSDPGE